MATTQMMQEDFTAVRQIHEDYAEYGWLTSVGAKMAARDVAEMNESLAMFLVEQANKMTGSIRIEDVMRSVVQWARR